MKQRKIAVLVDPNEIYPPSDKMALDFLGEIGKSQRCEVDILTKKDINKLKNYSALFIRTLTNVEDYTYQWSLLAQYRKMNLLDTPKGISLGCNKNIQYQLCMEHKIHLPKTQFIYAFDDLDKLDKKINLKFPLVMKVPNGSFSNGVYKIHDLDELKKKAQRLFHNKKLYSLILQEYIYTEYDWRIGILNKKPLFACKYFMAKDHWQIIKYHDEQSFDEGDAETVSIHKVPAKVMGIVSKIIPLIDNGLYGIDVKILNNKSYFIEINDNPNICFNVEDQVGREKIYKKLINQLIGN